jgi:glycosyltransferase involved in cell wall biosynthesis
MDPSLEPFSVLMSLYDRENPDFLRQSLQSLVDSTVRPNEVVLVEDGPISRALTAVVDEFREYLNVVSLPLISNVGFPAALNFGLSKCSYELVARFDTDDICLPDRFFSQLDFMKSNPQVAAVSGVVREFDSSTGEWLGLRQPPCCHEDILRYAKLRSPLNHPAAMFRKSVVLAVDGYPSDMKTAYEEYVLWVRIILAGHRLANLEQVIVYMRAGKAQVLRRSGIRYAIQEYKFAGLMRALGFFDYFDFIRFIFFRIPIRFLPKRILFNVYQQFGRNAPPSD